MIAAAETIVSVGAKVAMIEPAIAEIGTDAIGAAHRAAMKTTNREGSTALRTRSNHEIIPIASVERATLHGREKAAAIFACLLLSGCVTAEEQAKLDDSKCQSYGAKPGSPGYFACRTQLENERNPLPPSAPVMAPPAILEPRR
jgi:hypothetical protein